MRYIAKPDTWFDAGTDVTLIDDFSDHGWMIGLFGGLRHGRRDEEVCRFEEFEVIDDADDRDIPADSQ